MGSIEARQKLDERRRLVFGGQDDAELFQTDGFPE
jgi:hypothetical protein